MLTKFAAALIATSLVASSALAAQSLGTSGATPAAQTGQMANPANVGKTNAGKSATTHKAVKAAKHQPAHVRKRLASGESHMRHARHNAPAKTHQAGRRQKREAFLSASRDCLRSGNEHDGGAN